MWTAMKSAALVSLALPLSIATTFQSPPVYPSPQGKGTGQWSDAYSNARALVGEMTLEEMVNITRGFPHGTICAGMTGSVPRLGYPGLCLHDAGNGVRGADLVSAFPSALHVGAAWDKNMTYQRGWFMGREFKAKGVNILLGPNAGPLGRVAVGGRNWEGFSVDPYLSGKLVAESIIGHQDAGVIANLKHFIGNEQETYRRPLLGVEAVSSNIDDKTLHEFYLWPFIDGIHAGVASVMCSYQRINNTYACDNSKTLNGILKGELDFQGFVMLDWGAVHKLTSANAGLDMVMPQGGYFGQNLTDAVHNGTVSKDRVTDMATRIVASWYLVGQEGNKFPTPGIGMKNLTEPHEQIDARDPASKHVLLQGAIDGHVLLKNTGVLPFKKAPNMISVYGYDATIPRTKNTDKLFNLGYTSYPEMGPAELEDTWSFDQPAMGGTIITGGRAAANAPPFISDPISAIQYKAYDTDAWVNWDLDSHDPEVNGATDVCLVFINAMATERYDRSGLHDDFSDGLVRNVADKCANTIVVIHNAGIRLVDQWIDHPNVTATIMAHLPGQNSGQALVKLLYGEAEFSGKLPYTIAKNETDYGNLVKPCNVTSAQDKSPQCEFTEGSYIDYRAFDAQDIEPRFEFGFGLSYTTFDYSDLAFYPKDLNSGSIEGNAEAWDTAAVVTATITNTGDRPGDEIAQLYLAIPNSAPRQLRGFEKIRLLPKESATVRFELDKRDFAVWDVVEQKWVVQKGEYEVFVGTSSRKLPLHKTFKVSQKALNYQEMLKR